MCSKTNEKKSECEVTCDDGFEMNGDGTKIKCTNKGKLRFNYQNY